MATNYVKGRAETSLYTNASGSTITSDSVVVMGATDGKKVSIGVADHDIADGESGTVYITGCFTLPKVAAAVIAQGDAVNWDASEGAVEDNAHTTGAGDVAEFGRADEAAGATTTTVNVWIDYAGTYDAA